MVMKTYFKSILRSFRRNTAKLISLTVMDLDADGANTRIYAYPSFETNINRLKVEGRLPQAAGEILAERQNNESQPLGIGDTVSVMGMEFEIVWLVSNPLIFDRLGEPDMLAQEPLERIFYLSSEFLPLTLPVTDAYIRIAGLEERDIFSDGYQDAAAETAAALSAELGEGFTVLTMQENKSAATAESYCEKVSVIAAVFPVFFILVAALVVMTTMTRVIEEERAIIGCLRSLGAGDGRILFKYLFMAAVCCAVAAALGFALGLTVLPAAILPAFDTVFFMPAAAGALHPLMGIVSAAAMFAVVLAVTAGVCKGSLREQPAQLLVPRAPKPGKRIFLERIGFFWNRLSFKYKSSLRNIFRYKKHLVMTVVSVAGSTALAFAGFGLWNVSESVDGGTFAGFEDSLKPISFVVIAFALLLCVFVIYNLTNMNIGERKREIATLAVLGYRGGEILVEPCRTDISGQIGEYPDWEKFERDVRENCQNQDGIGVIELYSFKNGAVIEREAKERIAKIADIPVTCGYELFREPNSLQRGAGTLLNAGLYPVIEDFLRAVRRAMRARGIDAPAVIMRSDGSLMSEEFARKHPVETLLCGPAASVAGGYALSREKNAVIVDMGGTTTDIAIVQGGLPVRANDGVTVGKWRTYVDGMLIRTFGLGGDSAVHYRGKKLVLEEYRVVPLCAAASRYPAMRERLSRFAASGAGVHTQFRFEFYMLAREPRSPERYTEREQKLIAALAGGPLILDDAAAAVGQDIYTFNPSRLIKEGIVQVCGLTPTDLMHVRGDFLRFDAEISRTAAEIVAQNLGITAEALCELVYREIEHKMYTNIVKILLQVQDSFFAKNGFDRASEHFIEESYRLARGERGGAMIRAPFATDFKLVGIGAPIRLFLGGVAELLGTEADVPEHGEVANALGAVTGNVYASSEAEIRTGFLDTGAQGYFVYGEGETRAFAEEEEAERYAEELAKTAARGKAADRGAAGEIAVTCQKKRHTAEIGYGDGEGNALFVGTTFTAQAIGTVGYVQ